MNNILVSVIIPSYKNADVIDRAIQSVLNQSYKNIEVIVVDDNNPVSKERIETEQKMSIYSRDQRVVYLKHEKNKNGAAARNTGIKYSHGDYIAFLDADDWFLPQKIEKQLLFMENNACFDACYCFAQRGGKVIKAEPYEGDATKDLLMMRTKMFTPALFFRRDAIDKIKGFDESYRRHQDYELLLRFFQAGYTIGCVKEILLELGTSENRNSLDPQSLLELKKKYLNDFSDVIDSINNNEKRFKKRIYALHYGKVFLVYILNKKYSEAIKLSTKYFWFSPYYFTFELRHRIAMHF